MMKATFNGIHVEGTPDEIIEYMQKSVMQQMVHPYPFPTVAPVYDQYWKVPMTNPLKWNEITCGGTISTQYGQYDHKQ